MFFGVFLVFGVVFEVLGLFESENLAGYVSSGCVWRGVVWAFLTSESILM